MGTVVDLFAGAGGWDLACRRAGQTVVRVETSPPANATARAAGFTTAPIRNVWAARTTGVDGIVASPPCQPFSAAAKNANQDAQLVLDAVGPDLTIPALLALSTACRDRKSALALLPLYHVATSRPDWTAWEQVPGVLPLWRACAGVLQTLGYHTWCGVLQSEAYGVPQTRKRAVLIAAHHHVDEPVRTHSRYYARNPARRDPGVPPFITLADALGEIEVLSTYSTHGNYRGSRDQTQPSATVTTKTSRNKVFGWVDERPATTVVSSHSPEYLAAPGWRTAATDHRQDADGSIRITPAQAGVLQSFPPDYPWRGTLDQRFTQVGNAIPPLLAEAIIKEALHAGPRQ